MKPKNTVMIQYLLMNLILDKSIVKLSYLKNVERDTK